MFQLFIDVQEGVGKEGARDKNVMLEKILETSISQ